MKETVDMAAFKTALAELGVPDLDEPWRSNGLTSSLGAWRSGVAVSFTISGEQLGRCYHQTTSLTLGDESQAPSGNCGNRRRLSRGTHPLLGPWVMTVCEIDSSD